MNSKMPAIGRPQAQNEEKYYSSDEEVWETPLEPVINVLTFGWTEDGRCGYKDDAKMQLCPRPVEGLLRPTVNGKQFVCKKASAGSRHSAFLMINHRKEPGRFGRKCKKLMLVGLNQTMLCEDPGTYTPLDIAWDADEVPLDIIAGYGTTFVITKIGNLYSFGYGKYGVLGHGDEVTSQIPRQITELNKYRVKQVSPGRYHVICSTYSGKLFGWGRNSKGQLGLGRFSEMELTPVAVELGTKDVPIDISCGFEHTVAIIQVTRKDNTTKRFVYGWGDYTHDQLGSCEISTCSRPTDIRWVTRYLQALGYTAERISAGGYHNMLLVAPVGQVITWGDGQYGQLGGGYMWNNPKPYIIPNLKGVTCISAGHRHCVAVCGTEEVYVWGDNSYGQLGLADTNIRLQPTLLTASKKARVVHASAGERHTILVTSHKPMVSSEQPSLREYFKILETSDTPLIRHSLKEDLRKNGIDPTLLDDPMAVVKEQAGLSLAPVRNEPFEFGLRYCMDTRPQAPQLQWRRKGFETCFECPSLKLKTVCMACARKCHKDRYLRIYLRRRNKPTDQCDCHTSSYCECSWTPIREEYDKFSIEEDDELLGPNRMRALLEVLRAPAPVDQADVEDCLTELAQGDEEADKPRIRPVAFEKWYRNHYQEFDDELPTAETNDIPTAR